MSDIPWLKFVLLGVGAWLIFTGIRGIARQEISIRVRLPGSPWKQTLTGSPAVLWGIFQVIMTVVVIYMAWSE